MEIGGTMAWPCHTYWTIAWWGLTSRCNQKSCKPQWYLHVFSKHSFCIPILRFLLKAMPCWTYKLFGSFEYIAWSANISLHSAAISVWVPRLNCSWNWSYRSCRKRLTLLSGKINISTILQRYPKRCQPFPCPVCRLSTVDASWFWNKIWAELLFGIFVNSRLFHLFSSTYCWECSGYCKWIL